MLSYSLIEGHKMLLIGHNAYSIGIIDLQIWDLRGKQNWDLGFEG